METLKNLLASPYLFLGLAGWAGCAGCAASALFCAKLRRPLLPARHWTMAVGKVIGHRGCRTEEHPSGNTMGSFNSALATRSLWGIEFDLQLTVDGKLVVFHDADTANLLEGPPEKVSRMQCSELRKRRFKNVHDQNEVIPMFDDVLKLARDRNMHVVVEMKGFQRSKEMASKVQAALEKHGMLDSCMVISFNFLSLYYLRQQSSVPTALLAGRGHFVKAMPSLPLAFASTVDAIYIYFAMAPWALPCFIGATGVGPAATLLSQDYASRIIRAGYTIDTWTVNSGEVARRLRGWCVNQITTDFPADIDQREARS
ncbi:putative glycerophosphoryl diester phosphodiesterase YhdW [Diplonema papillatum]|nr:putative glycerophosphoryl diester phosphodiesterase YhdW [Diplonema papillatum]